MDSIVTTTSLDLTIPNRSRAANSIALGSFVNRWISRCRPWLASRSLSISDSIFCRWAEDAFNSARDRMTAVQQMAVVARTIVVKITQDGSARAPLMTGSTSSRAVKVGLLIIRIGWATVGLLAARLSSHSVFPKLCKRHLQYVRENSMCARTFERSIIDLPAFPPWRGEGDGAGPIRAAKPTFSSSRCAKCRI